MDCPACVLVTITQPDAPTDRLSIHTDGNIDAALVVLVTAVGTMLNPQLLGETPWYAGRSLFEILEGVCQDLGIRATKDRSGGMPITFDLGAQTARLDARGKPGAVMSLEDWMAASGWMMKRRHEARQAVQYN